MSWILQIIREIKAVGLKDWWWFAVVLKRDEFNTPTHIFDYDPSSYSLTSWYEKIARERERAHRIDMVLSDVDHICI